MKKQFISVQIVEQGVWPLFLMKEEKIEHRRRPAAYFLLTNNICILNHYEMILFVYLKILVFFNIL